MGWQERDWARLTRSERRERYGVGGTRTRGAAPFVGSALVLALGISLALYVGSHYPRGHPYIRSLAFRLPFVARSHAHIDSVTAHFGSTYTLRGTTPGGQGGRVEADGSWNGGPWENLAVTSADGGDYTLRFRITERGSLKLRVKYPGGEADGTVIVP